MKSLRCIFNFHKWKFYRTKTETRRKCILCGKKEERQLNYAYPHYAGNEYDWVEIK